MTLVSFATHRVQLILYSRIPCYPRSLLVSARFSHKDNERSLSALLYML